MGRLYPNVPALLFHCCINWITVNTTVTVVFFSTKIQITTCFIHIHNGTVINNVFTIILVTNSKYKTYFWYPILAWYVSYMESELIKRILYTCYYQTEIRLDFEIIYVLINLRQRNYCDLKKQNVFVFSKETNCGDNGYIMSMFYFLIHKTILNLFSLT